MDQEKQPINLSTLLAFVVLIALVLLLPVYWKWIGYEPAPTPPAAPADTIQVTTAPSQEQTPTAVAELPQRQPDTRTLDTATGFFVADSTWTEDYTTVTTPHFDAVLSNRGARLLRLVLKDYRYNDEERKGLPIVLLDSTDDAGPGFEFFAEAHDLADAPFVADRRSITLTGDDSALVRFTAANRNGTEWTIVYTFFGDRFDFHTRLTIPEPWRDNVERELHYGWQGGLWPTEPDPGDDNGNFAAVALMGKDIERIGGIDRAEPVKDLTGETHWAAVRTKYFVCAVVPETPGDGFRAIGRERSVLYEGKRLDLKQFSALVRRELRAGEPIDLTWTVYAGPIDYDALKEYGVGLEEMVDLGWRWVVRPFALVILWLFQILHSVIPNYGVVIILFALLIKAVFHPLTKKQMRSMRRMQSLQPKMEKLKERLKKDPQRMNQEVMKLYKDAGVNPMAGCLPLLPQLPIFYALFQVFRTTIELRGAYFFGWLTDLSQKDPYYILPIIMTVSMFVQQKMSTKDPKQKMLTYMMPLLFGFLFRNFPAGLTLYWTIYNISSVVEQTWLIGHPSKDPDLNGGEVGSGEIEMTGPGKKPRKR